MMDKDLLIILARDLTRSIKIMITAVEMNNIILAREALVNAANELTALRRMLGKKNNWMMHRDKGKPHLNERALLWRPSSIVI